jgi:acetylornithine/succinyldiaminopimelate/putrescine aminotransferase
VKSNLIPESTACEPRTSSTPSVTKTCDQIIRAKIPNFFRLYLNPFVVQACFCLSKYVQSIWPENVSDNGGYQTFLANAFDEALSGAIKLARYWANSQGRSAAGLVIDPTGRLGPFASITIEKRGRIEFIPNLVVLEGTEAQLQALCRAGKRFSMAVLVAAPASALPSRQDALRSLLREQKPLIITCIDRNSLAACRQTSSGLLATVTPDIVVFDESFVNDDVPFGAFTARKALFEPWNQPGKSTFHSTTFQPNTIASLHFLKCLEQAEPNFYSSISGELERIKEDAAFCSSLLGKLYSPFLARAIQRLGFDTPHVQAAGHYIVAGRRKIFDCVAGVACSIRGHNPNSYVEEIARLESLPDSRSLASARLQELTGLEYLLPAVSGATAVENALRIGLAAHFPKKYVLAFKGGFGGKTLLALTGTARSTYKQYLEPLYENVLYIDPFGPDVLEELESALRNYPVAVVQLELIQAVGGVRPIPAPVIDYLECRRRQWGYLLFVDEVQTGMYRTGPFVLSQERGVRPDILTIGKGTSDMMFPFALTLYSAAVREKLQLTRPTLPEALDERLDYEWGYKTVLNVLAQAERLRLPDRVAKSGALFARLLSEELASCKAVRAVRVHGLLIAIELDTSGWLWKWLQQRATELYLLSMLEHGSFPLFVGFCQYEPNILKLTPPLSITPDEVRHVCRTLSCVLRTSPYRVLGRGMTALLTSFVKRVWKSSHRNGQTYEPVKRELSGAV